ncbi:hypothetical protein A1OE_437 [Candidatus Endolissoclinum faulkneri L2]|uniref:Uncharacterized protein n=1 Tax=Candidatus Endolissoclinum faulkneri L2 TaxID=1193729 RepID=K7YG98_9PROT|nr:hypothetical protein A1OE_437 [Candidatus Endolissoclinum faulkneri L2]
MLCCSHLIFVVTKKRQQLNSRYNSDNPMFFLCKNYILYLFFCLLPYKT